MRSDQSQSSDRTGASPVAKTYRVVWSTMPRVFLPRVWGLVPRGLVLTAASLPVIACSLVTDTDGLSLEDALLDGAPTTNETPTGDADGSADAVAPPAPPGTCPNAGYSCVAEPPAGWAGPVILYDGPDIAAPGCPTTMANTVVDGHKGFGAPAAHSCSQCTCAKGTMTCDPQLITTDKPACSGTSSIRGLSIGNCIPATGVSLGFSAFANKVDCPANDAVPTRPDPTWTSKVRACSAPSLLRTGCDSGKVCAPDAPSPFQGRHCIVANGDVACPDGPYTAKTVVASSVDDGRGCAPCQCEGQVGSEYCIGNMQFFPNFSNCTGTPVGLTGTFPCADGAGSVKLLSVTGTPTCVPVAGTGAPTGEVKPAELTTTCCLP